MCALSRAGGDVRPWCRRPKPRRRRRGVIPTAPERTLESDRGRDECRGRERADLGGGPRWGASARHNLGGQPCGTEAASGVGGNVASPAAAPSRPAQSANPFRPRPDAASESELRQGQQGQQSQRALGTPRPESKLARENNARAGRVESEQRETVADACRAAGKVGRTAAACGVTVPPPPPPPAMPAPRPPAAPPPAATTADARSDLLRSSETFFATAPIIAEFVVGADLQAQEVEAFGAVADLNRAGGAGLEAAVAAEAPAGAPLPVAWRGKPPASSGRTCSLASAWSIDERGSGAIE